MSRDIKAVIFDLDGTLIDSMWVWSQIDLDYFNYLNIEIPANLKDEINHLSFKDTAIYFKQNFNIPDSVESIIDTWNTMALHYYQNSVMLKPGVLEYLNYLKSNNIKIGLATSNSHVLLNAALIHNNIVDFFDVIVTTDDIASSKDCPDVYLATAEKLMVEPHNCLVFEDILEAVKGAKLADMTVFAVYDKYSAYQRDELLTISDRYIQDFYELLSN